MLPSKTSLAALLALVLAACGGSEHDLGSSEQAAKAVGFAAGGGGGGAGGGATTLTLKADLAATAASPTSSGTVTYVNTGSKVSLRATFATADLPVDTVLCVAVDGAVLTCDILAGVAVPYTSAFRFDTLARSGLDLVAGAVVEVRLSVDTAGLLADTVLASATL